MADYQDVDTVYKSTIALVPKKAKGVLSQLSSLHHEVPSSMKLKYLVIQFVTNTEFDIHVLAKVWARAKNLFGADKIRDLEGQLVNYDIHGTFSKLQEVLFDVDQLNHWKKLLVDHNFHVPSSTFCKFQEVLFGIDQLSYLNELLVDYAHKWKDIGVALGFRPQDLDNIQACPHLLTRAPRSYLTRLLEEWVIRRFEHTLPPTKEALEKALSSRLVGLGKLSVKVPSTSVALNQSLSYSLITVFFNEATVEVSSDHVKLKDGIGTLLEVGIANCTGKKSPCYHYFWSVSDNAAKEHCVGFSSPTLCIMNADIDIDGCEFSCTIQCSSASTGYIQTPPVLLEVSSPLDIYRASLASVYLAQPEVPENTWPPVGSKKYINLALIKQQKMNCSSEYARLTIRGDMDDILQHKEMIGYDELFKGLKSGQLVFIEGRPGSGKTTFVHKIAQDWALSSSGPIRLLLLVSLRVLNTIARPNLSGIIKLFRNLKVSQGLLEKYDGKGVCFIFDGLDEFLPCDGEKSIVYEIINRKYLTKSIVVVASRPVALAKIRHRADKVVEVLGFMGKQILEYFDHYPFSNQSKSAILKAYLSFHPNVYHMCYLPIHTVIVAFLFEVTGQVPKTETDIYKHFTRFTLMRSLTKSKKLEQNLVSIEDLSGEQRNNFEQICWLALHKTLLNKQVLHQDEVRSFFKVKQDSDISLGLITVDRTAGLYGYTNLYTFLHLTFQEYLAAYYISTLSDDEQIRLIEEHGGKDHMLVVWKFYFGLVKIEPFQDKFKLVLSKTKDCTLFHIQCAYESQQAIACAQLLKAINYHIRLENKYTRIPDFTAIGFLMNSSVLNFKLSLLNCNIDMEAINGLISEISDNARHSLQYFHVETESSKLDCINELVTNAPSLNDLLLHVNVRPYDIGVDVRSIVSNNLKRIVSNVLSLKSLVFEVNLRIFSPNDTGADVSYIVSTNITELSIINVYIKPSTLLSDLYFEKLAILNLSGSIPHLNPESTELFTFLQHCKNLKELNLSDGCIDEWDAVVLAKSLRHCTSLERIVISYNYLQNTGIETILASIQQCYLKVKEEEIVFQKSYQLSGIGLLRCLENFSNLLSLQVTIDSDNVDYFPCASKSWKKLKELQLSLQSKDVSFGKVVFIFSCFQYFKDLQMFTLTKCMTKGQGVKELMVALRHCPSLQILDLSDNQIGSPDVRAVFDDLMYFTHLKELNLSNNKIGNDGAKVFLHFLQNCHDLQLCKVDLLNNGIGCKRISALKSFLYQSKCNKLKSLVLNC